MTASNALAPPPLRPRLGPRLGGFDASALAKAEAALKSLSGQFAGWLQDELARLDAAHAAVQAQGLAGPAGEALYNRAHDLKGLGGTYEFPLVTPMAGSLCRLLELPARALVSPPLVAAHVDAIRAAVAGDIRTDGDPVGGALAEELERNVSAHLASLGERQLTADSGSTTAP